MSNLTICNVRPMDAAAMDIHIKDGIFADAPAAGAQRLDGLGRLALPGLVDTHMHLDKTLWGLPWRPHSAGKSLAEKIVNERAVRDEFDADIAVQATRLIKQASANGTVAIRTHVDVDPDLGLDNLEAVKQACDDNAARMDVQIVAFPQTGLVSRPGTAELLEQAIHEGADLVGGIDPAAIDGDADGHIRAVFGIAERTGAGIDIHHHEEGEPGARTLDKILDAVAAHGMQGQVTLSHAFCIGMVDEKRMRRLIERIAELRVTVMTAAPGYKPFPPLMPMREKGVAVCAGSDGVRDVWSPYGNADMLERAMLLGYRSNFRRDDEITHVLDICSRGGAEALGRPRHGLVPGAPGDLVLLDAETPAEAVIMRPQPRSVIKSGRVVADGTA